VPGTGSPDSVARLPARSETVSPTARLAVPVRSVEPVALVFRASGEQPTVLALRPDFPETMHQNWTPNDMPHAVCVDDRPWAEAQLTFTPADFLRRIQLWLAKAARGELYDTAQPLEPLFFRNPAAIILPAAALAQAGNTAELVGHVRSEHATIPFISRATVQRATAKPFRSSWTRVSPGTNSWLWATDMDYSAIAFVGGGPEPRYACVRGLPDNGRYSYEAPFLTAGPNNCGATFGVSHHTSATTVTLIFRLTDYKLVDQDGEAANSQVDEKLSATAAPSDMKL